MCFTRQRSEFMSDHGMPDPMKDALLAELVEALDGLMQLRAHEATRTPVFSRPYRIEDVEDAIKVQLEHLRRVLVLALDPGSDAEQPTTPAPPADEEV
jgi:hypothetical protein